MLSYVRVRVRYMPAVSDWPCSHCDFSLPAPVVEAKIDAIEDELSDLISIVGGGNSIKRRPKLDRLEEFVDCYSGAVLHENHYLLMLAKRNYVLLARKKVREYWSYFLVKLDASVAYRHKLWQSRRTFIPLYVEH